MKKAGEVIMIVHKKKCFIITPISNKDSDIRKEIESIIDNAIEPAIGEKFDIKVAHREFQLGSIIDGIIKMIYEADLIIANVTDLNPNVIYELGLAHGICKPVIIISNERTKLSFDLSVENTLFFSDGPACISEIKEGIKKMECRIDYERGSFGPVYSTLKANVLEKKLQETNINLKDELFLFWEDAIKRLETKIDESKNTIDNNIELPLYVKSTGWKEENGEWVYVDKNGEKETNEWEKSGDNWFYLGPDGHLIMDDLIRYKGDIYYVDENGAMVNNMFVFLNEGKMYFGENGKAIMDGEKKIGDTIYNFKKGIVIEDM